MSIFTRYRDIIKVIIVIMLAQHKLSEVESVNNLERIKTNFASLAALCG